MNLNLAEQALNEIGNDRETIDRYNKYWGSVTPITNLEIRRRYIFSFLSVHTPWSSNVSSFLLLEKNQQVYNNKEELTDLLIESRAGNYKVKSAGIHKFVRDFNDNPDFYKLDEGPSHQAQRNAIMKQCYGLGLAKTAFALEMCFPLTAEVVCLDTHLLQLYGFIDSKERAKVREKQYIEMETHWLNTCKSLDIAPMIARAIWWDKKQQQTDSRY